MDHIFSEYGKIITSVIGIIIAISMVAACGFVLNTTLNDGMQVMEENAKTNW